MFFGGPIGDRFGRKYVIWFSILGALPFTLALPYAGLLLERRADASHRPHHLVGDAAIIVFAQELMPHRVGMISGIFFGVAFGVGGLGAAVLGQLADRTASTSSSSRLRVPAGDRPARDLLLPKHAEAHVR